MQLLSIFSHLHKTISANDVCYGFEGWLLADLIAESTHTNLLTYYLLWLSRLTSKHLRHLCESYSTAISDCLTSWQSGRWTGGVLTYISCDKKRVLVTSCCSDYVYLRNISLAFWIWISVRCVIRKLLLVPYLECSGPHRFVTRSSSVYYLSRVTNKDVDVTLIRPVYERLGFTITWGEDTSYYTITERVSRALVGRELWSMRAYTMMRRNK